MEQMIFSDSQTSVTKLDWRVSGIPISDTRTSPGHALFSPREYDATYSRIRVFCQRETRETEPLHCFSSRAEAWHFYAGHSYVCAMPAVSSLGLSQRSLRSSRRGIEKRNRDHPLLILNWMLLLDSCLPQILHRTLASFGRDDYLFQVLVMFSTISFYDSWILSAFTLLETNSLIKLLSSLDRN